MVNEYNYKKLLEWIDTSFKYEVPKTYLDFIRRGGDLIFHGEQPKNCKKIIFPFMENGKPSYSSMDERGIKLFAADIIQGYESCFEDDLITADTLPIAVTIVNGIISIKCGDNKGIYFNFFEFDETHFIANTFTEFICDLMTEEEYGEKYRDLD